MTVPPNSRFQLTDELAAHGVLRPPCLLRSSAAEARVRQSETTRLVHCQLTGVRRKLIFAPGCGSPWRSKLWGAT